MQQRCTQDRKAVNNFDERRTFQIIKNSTGKLLRLGIYWMCTGRNVLIPVTSRRNAFETQLIDTFPNMYMDVSKVHEVARSKAATLKYRYWRSTHEILLPLSYYNQFKRPSINSANKHSSQSTVCNIIIPQASHFQAVNQRNFLT